MAQEYHREPGGKVICSDCQCYLKETDECEIPDLGKFKFGAFITLKPCEYFQNKEKKR